MAPTPTDGHNPIPLQPTTSHPKPDEDPHKLSTASIVALGIFGFFLVCFAVTFIGFCLHKRAQLKRLPPDLRPVSTYRPYRNSSDARRSRDKAGLLANAAEVPETPQVDDGDRMASSMFSRHRASSVNLYVPDEQQYDPKRASMETVSLIPVIPLNIIPPGAEGTAYSPLGRENSNNGRSPDRLSVGTMSLISPTLSRNVSGASAVGAGEDVDLGVRKHRHRSSSFTRYYDKNGEQLSPMSSSTPGGQ
ncbi:hypothetical protein GQ43DRAFT_430301 [Delitschia confertaspora ATCC 74209]|uniref:Uncharacterized protein n=1 Tax=Delitschia confertaspora ATCC 74209 TaxID=1513339 RepID=A0A9P4JRA7_9PLEO|nr:hypothetical protein GQ43DRAFT_430301 [Delitschia confertaspora ATCC 74209]